MRTLFAVALAIAFSRDRRHRWRQISIIVAAFLATAACGIALALPYAAKEAYVLGSSRGPVFASQPAPGADDAPEDAVAVLLYRAMVVDGEQVPAVWIEPIPGHEDDPEAVPLGLSELPPPGSAVLSPGLVKRGYAAEDFGWATSASGTNADGSIGYPGIMTSSEPLIIVRPAGDRSLATSSVEQYVSGFGSPPSADGVAFAMDPEFMGPRAMAIGSFAFVILPALVLIISGARARSSLREDRMRFLVGLGIAQWRARTLVAVETGALAAVGSVSAAVPWWILSHHVTTIPITGITVRSGGLSAPWWLMVLTVTLIIMLAASVGALGTLDSPRNRPPRKRMALVATVTMLGAAVLLSLTALGRMPFTDPMAPNTVLILVGVFGVLVCTPLAMPQLIAWAGWAVQRLPSPTMWATGRRMAAEPQYLSRIASVLSVLVILVSSGLALGLGSSHAEAGRNDDTAVHGTSVSWVSAQDGDVDRVTEVLGTGRTPLLVLPIVEVEEETEGQGAAASRLLVRDCAEALRIVGLRPVASATCTGDAAEAMLEDMLHADVVTPQELDGRTATNAVAVFSAGGLDIRSIQKELGWLPGLNVRHDSRIAPAPLPIHRWIRAGLVAVSLLAGMAAIREIGDKSISDAGRDAVYARVGVSHEAMRRLSWASLLVPVILSVMVAAAMSTVIVYAGQSIELMRQEPFKLAVVSLSTVAITVLAVAVSLPVRRAIPD